MCSYPTDTVGMVHAVHEVGTGEDFREPNARTRGRLVARERSWAARDAGRYADALQSGHDREKIVLFTWIDQASSRKEREEGAFKVRERRCLIYWVRLRYPFDGSNNGTFRD